MYHRSKQAHATALSGAFLPQNPLSYNARYVFVQEAQALRVVGPLAASRGAPPPNTATRTPLALRPPEAASPMDACAPWQDQKVDGFRIALRQRCLMTRSRAARWT